MATHQLVLTPTRTFSLSSEVATTWQTDGAAHKLKPRSFHKSAHFQVHSADFHPSVNCAWQPQSTLTTSNPSSFKNNLQPLCKLLSSFSILSTQLQLWIWTLHQNILLALSNDLIATKHISADGWWSMDPNSLLLLNNRIYVPSADNLCTHILQYNHDHILARYFGQNKILELVCCRYSWPSLYSNV